MEKTKVNILGGYKMEDEIKEELEKRYKNLEIEVDFIEFRKYSITIRLNESTLTLEYIVLK